jgi:hypothetical protein
MQIDSTSSIVTTNAMMSKNNDDPEAVPSRRSMTFVDGPPPIVPQSIPGNAYAVSGDRRNSRFLSVVGENPLMSN